MSNQQWPQQLKPNSLLETRADSETSTVKLGKAAAGKSNAVEIGGTVDTLNITGGSGADVITFTMGDTTGTSAIKGSTIDLKGQAGDTLDMTNFTSTTAFNGVAVNFGSSNEAIAYGANKTTTLKAGALNLFDENATGTKLSTDTNFAVAGIKQFVGTANDDAIYSSNLGMTITGGAGADDIFLSSGFDTVVFTDATTIDTVQYFKSGQDVLNVDALLTVGTDGADGFVEGDVVLVDGAFTAWTASGTATNWAIVLSTDTVAEDYDASDVGAKVAEKFAETAGGNAMGLAVGDSVIYLHQDNDATAGVDFDAQVFVVRNNAGTIEADLVALVGTTGDSTVLQVGDFA